MIETRIFIGRITAFLLSLSIALNIWFYIEIKNLRLGIEMYRDMINDYSDGNLDVIRGAIIDNIKTRKLKKDGE